MLQPGVFECDLTDSGYESGNERDNNESDKGCLEGCCGISRPVGKFAGPQSWKRLKGSMQPDK